MSAADLYKSVDASGKITYSDHVSREAGKVQVIKVQRVNGVTGNKGNSSGGSAAVVPVVSAIAMAESGVVPVVASPSSSTMSARSSKSGSRGSSASSSSAALGSSAKRLPQHPLPTNRRWQHRLKRLLPRLQRLPPLLLLRRYRSCKALHPLRQS